MRSANNLSHVLRAIALGGAFCCAAFVSGCGMPAAPQPPSLKLPEPVRDLTASRAGNDVSLAWTMPKRDTSKVMLKADETVAARVCRSEGAASGCATVVNLVFAPGAHATFTETLLAELATGAPRPLRYFIELSNRRGRTAGPSNAATVLAGQAPAPVSSLSAEVRKDGVVLRWAPGPPEPYETTIRLERTLLTPPAKSTQGPLASPAEPTQQNFLVPAGGVHGRAIDKSIRFGETYEYRAQRIAPLTVEGKMLELDGPFSAPVRVEAQDVFPPAVPTGLAAVATPAMNGAGPSIDLSWQPDTEPELAGYAVSRREAASEGQPPAAWQRISGAQPVPGPGYHDPNVEPGHTYQYAVSAVGQNGRESENSAPAEETVPGP